MPQIANTILMVRPASFGFNSETAANNAFQQKIDASTAQISRQAVEEFDQFVAKLEKNQVDVLVIQDTASPIKPDAVFPNNWFCTMPDGKVIVFPMYAPNRREEKSDELLLALTNKFKTTDVEDWSEYEADNFFLEGTGSMIFDHENKTVYACLSDRTHKGLLETFSHNHGYKAIHFFAMDEKDAPIYHTNVMMHIGETYAVICLDAIKDATERIWVSQNLNESGHEVIPITQEQVRQFAGNMIQIKNKHQKKYTILSQSAYDSLTTEQIEILSIHSHLLPVDIQTIETIGGGSARCMVAEVFLERK